MRPAEVTPAVLASCSSVKREINRKRALPVTPEIRRGVGAVHQGTGLGGRRDEERWRMLLGVSVTICFFSALFSCAGGKLTKCF